MNNAVNGIREKLGQFFIELVKTCKRSQKIILYCSLKIARCVTGKVLFQKDMYVANYKAGIPVKLHEVIH